MWTKILAYFLFVLGLVTISYFRNYSGEVIPHPFLFYLAGLALFIAGFLLLRRARMTPELKIQKQIAASIKELKTSGEKIEVDLSQCEIKEHNYTEERQLFNEDDDLLAFDMERRMQAYNALDGNSMRNVQQVEVTQTALIYDYLNPQTGELERFVSRVIPKDQVTLSFYLDRQKKTNLYVDRKNRKNYYFDLDFLNE